MITADINGNVRALSFALSHPLVFGATDTQAARKKRQFQPLSRVRLHFLLLQSNIVGEGIRFLGCTSAAFSGSFVYPDRSCYRNIS